MQIALIEHAGVTRELPLIDGKPDFSGVTEPSKTILQNAFDDGHYTVYEVFIDDAITE
jgi:hypothetical protein